MPTVRKSVIVHHPAAAMFALVDDVERYPRIPAVVRAARRCSSAPRPSRTRASTSTTTASRARVTTRNRKQPPEWMHLEFTEGPFETFQGHWRFVPLGDDGCRVEFALDYGFENRALEALLGPVFGHIMETLVDRFVARADAEARP